VNAAGVAAGLACASAAAIGVLTILAHRPLASSVSATIVGVRWCTNVIFTMSKSATLPIATTALGIPHARCLFEKRVCRSQLQESVRKVTVWILAHPILECFAEPCLSEVRGRFNLGACVCVSAPRPISAIALKKVSAKPCPVQLLLELDVSCLLALNGRIRLLAAHRESSVTLGVGECKKLPTETSVSNLEK